MSTLSWGERKKIEITELSLDRSNRNKKLQWSVFIADVFSSYLFRINKLMTAHRANQYYYYVRYIPTCYIYSLRMMNGEIGEMLFRIWIL